MYWYSHIFRWCVCRVLIRRYKHLLDLNKEEDPGETEDSRYYWLGRRHELKFMMEELGIRVPALKLRDHKGR